MEVTDYPDRSQPMQFYPGDIVTDINVTKFSAKRGQIRFRQGNATCILDNFVPPQNGQTTTRVEKAVCVDCFVDGQKQRFHFRTAKYRSKVMDSLYSGGRLKARGSAAARNRWHELAFAAAQPKIEQFTPKQYHLNRFKSWRLIVTDRWEMPLPISEYNDCLADRDELFMPYPLPYGSEQFFLSPCYPKFCRSLPRRFKGIWTGPGGKEPRNIEIVLHGFLDLRKMHFGVRKHLLGCCGEPPQAKAAAKTIMAQAFTSVGVEVPREKDLWAKLLNADLAHNQNCMVFNSCPKCGREENESNCPPGCPPNTFATVNGKISPLITNYCQEFVTVFEKQATENERSVPIQLWSEDSFLADGSRIRLQVIHEAQTAQKMKAAYGGVFYESKENGRSPVLHISMLTLYFSNEQLYPPKNHFLQGTIAGVRGQEL